MKRKLVILLLMLILVASALTGCGPTPLASATVPVLSWDGTALAGVPYVERSLPLLTVHYAEPTVPSMAERLGAMVSQFLTEHQSWGRLLPGQRLDLWVIPDGYAWPAEIKSPDSRPRPALAVKPRVVVLEQRVVPGNVQDIYSLQKSGVLAAVATAVTQGELSPAYAVGWLHDGMGGVFTEEWHVFPGGQFFREFPGSFGYPFSPRHPTEILYVLDDTKPLGRTNISPLDAATGLAALVMDRWGIDWPERYARTPEELTPEAALMWATEAPNPGKAVGTAATRMKKTIEAFIWKADEANYYKGASFLDTSEYRLTPQQVEPIRKVVPAPAYRIAADWDPDTRTVSGEEQLTWTNGAGVPISRLYFNVWGNAWPMQWFGGSTTVESVAVDGRPAAFTFRGMDLEVPLGRSVAPGSTAEVTIRFATRLAVPVPPHPNAKDPNPLLKGTNPETEEVWLLTLWYPALAVLDDMGWRLTSFPVKGRMVADPSNFDVTITVPQGSLVSSPGSDAAVTAVGERTAYAFHATNQPEWIGRILVDK